MNLIALINSELLYAKALTEQVPYFKFASWIESTVQKEVIAQLFKFIRRWITLTWMVFLHTVVPSIICTICLTKLFSRIWLC